MADSRSGSSFVSDQRGVSAVLGFILIFGILILALTTYQAQIVPQENAATEFEHFQDVRDEMVGIRNSISTSGQADESQFSDLTLGTNYQTRTFTINPPPPSGTLQTSDDYNITIANDTHSTNVSTRFLEYQPRYFEIDIGSIWYEHSVLYLDERDRGNGVSTIEDQNILNDSTVRITALQNRFREGGTKRIALELYPQEDFSEGDGTFPTGPDLTVTIPTRLDNETYWDDELGGKDRYEGVDLNARAEGIHALNLSVDSDDLEINTVGTQSEPDEEPAKNIDPLSEGEDDTENPDNDLSTYDVFSTTDELRIEPEGLVDENNWDVRVTSRESGDPIEGATVDITTTNADIFDNDFPIDTEDTDSDGVPQFELEVADDAEDGDEAELFAAAGDDVDQVTVIVEEDGEPVLVDLYPNNEIESTNLAGNINDLRDQDETNWYEANNVGRDTRIRVQMDDPAQDIEGEQTVKFRVRATNTRGGGQVPDAEFYLYEDGSQIEKLGGDDVTSTSGQTFTLTFDAADLDNPSGEDVQFVVEGNSFSGGGIQGTVEIGYITWEPQ